MIRAFATKVKLIIPAHQKSKAIDLLLINSLSYISSKVTENRALEIVIYAKKQDEFKRLFKDNKIEFSFSKPYGFFSVLERLKERYGIFLGFLILVLSIYVSSLFVWRIEIQGNSSLTNDEIIDMLSATNFKVGCFIPTIDYDQLHNKILLENNEISWVSINIEGNVANVKIKESEIPKLDKNIQHSNIVAKCDGQIAEIILINGERVVKLKDTVKKGDILISGVIDSKSQGVRYVRASGEIKAYTQKEINIFVPFVEREKKYTNSVYNEIYYKIFNFKIKFPLKGGNCVGFYDTIEKRENFSLIGVQIQPIEKITKSFYEYTEAEVERSRSQVVDIAFSRFRNELDVCLRDATLISKDVATNYDNNGFYISCKLYCLEEIGTEIPFYLD